MIKYGKSLPAFFEDGLALPGTIIRTAEPTTIRRFPEVVPDFEASYRQAAGLSPTDEIGDAVKMALRRIISEWVDSNTTTIETTMEKVLVIGDLTPDGFPMTSSITFARNIIVTEYEPPSPPAQGEER